MSILIIAEHDNKNLSAATLNTVTAASQIGKEMDILVIGNSCNDVSKECSQIPQIRSILEADSEEYKNFVAENVSNLIIDLSKNYSHILAPSSTTG